MPLPSVEQSARGVIAACGNSGVLCAAADSTLYPHVWTRDVGFAAMGIVADSASGVHVAAVLRSLELICSGQSDLGRMPLKVDRNSGEPVAENSAGIDCGAWFAIAVFACREALGADAVAHLVEPAKRAIDWTRHLDLDGSQLIVSPEAGDWADMLPHRHHVLYSNAIYAVALRAVAELLPTQEGAFYREQASTVGAAINTALWVAGGENGEDLTEWLQRAETANAEWGKSGMYPARWGTRPFYLPYLAFRGAGRHFDLVGNCLTIAGGLAPSDRTAAILDYADAIGIDDPVPSRTIDPPILPGDADWRDHFHWRNLCVPGQYQNGGAWPFAGALHIVALVQAGRIARARSMYSALSAVCGSTSAPFPEWTHGRTGRSLGQVRQLWSATGLLWARAAVESGRVPVLGSLAP